jgi:hypothetical protein
MNMEMMKMAMWCPAAEHVPTTLTTVMDDPSPTPTTTNQDQGEATVEGEVASRREPPRRVQVDHPASRIIDDMNERTTRLRVRNNSHFTHAAFVATFESKDIGHTLCEHNWVNSMHEELESFERNQVWELVDPCDAPGFQPELLTLLSRSTVLTLVKRRSTWAITSKTSPTNPNDTPW